MEIDLATLEKFFHGFKWVLWAGATTLFHYRQNFYHWSLWVPVVVLLFLAVNLWWAEFFPSGPVLTVLTVTLVVVILAHLWGAWLHLVGVGNRVGGQNLNNHMVGPPVILPLIVFTVASLDLLRLIQGNGL